MGELRFIPAGTGLKITTGSYVGTGSTSPITINFGIDAKLLIISTSNLQGDRFGSILGAAVISDYKKVPISNVYWMSVDGTYLLKRHQNDNTNSNQSIVFYAENLNTSATYLNYPNMPYTWIAIG